MNYVTQFSGGLGSYLAARRIVDRHGSGNLKLVFCDVLIEDEDLYRFLIQASADVFNIRQDYVADLAHAALLLPTIESGRLDERRAMLSRLATETMKKIPGLYWIADGRTPWEVFHDVRFLGNSRVDPCSKTLKRELADAWHERECDRASTVRVLGLTHAEQSRIEGVRNRLAADGWETEFPMDDAPLLSRVTMMQACIDRGIQPPRLYYLGFKHNNCGGLCCKGGHAAANRLMETMPARYAYHEAKEQEFIEFIGKPVSMMTDRRGDGKKKTLTLKQFRERIQSGGNFDSTDWGSCSCFSTDEAGGP